MAGSLFITGIYAWAVAPAVWDVNRARFTWNRFQKRSGFLSVQASRNGKKHALRIWEWGSRKNCGPDSYVKLQNYGNRFI